MRVRKKNNITQINIFYWYFDMERRPSCESVSFKYINSLQVKN